MSVLSRIHSADILQAYKLFCDSNTGNWIENQVVMNPDGTVNFDETFQKFKLEEELTPESKTSYLRHTNESGYLYKVSVGALQDEPERQMGRGHELGHAILFLSNYPEQLEYHKQTQRKRDIVEAFCEFVGIYCMTPAEYRKDWGKL